MGGERASRTRQREAGKICAVCGITLDAPPWPGERRCDRCGPKRRRIYMHFQFRDGWQVSFLEADRRTSLRRTLTFADDRKLVEMTERGGADLSLADRASLKHAITVGRGGIWLNLTEEQYRKLW